MATMCRVLEISTSGYYAWLGRFPSKRAREDVELGRGHAARSGGAGCSDRLWVADITYVPTGSGFLYLAVVVDAFSRKVVGWAMEGHLRAELIVGGVNMALWQRRPTGVIHHSDQGSQYTSVAFGKRCREAGIRPRAEARRALFGYIEGWYNPHRRHSVLGYESPVGYERRYAESRAWERTEHGEAEHVAVGAGNGANCDRDES